MKKEIFKSKLKENAELIGVTLTDSMLEKFYKKQ